MKCAFHPDRDAVAACVNCGKLVCPECGTVLGGRYYCQPCANELFVSKPAAQTASAVRSAKLTTAAVLNIVAGAIAVLIGLVTVWIYGLGLIPLGLGVVAIIGGACALRSKNYGWALAGAICATLATFIIGIPALILIVLSRNEFS